MSESSSTERKRAYNRAWKERNKDRVREYNSEYHAANKEKSNQKSREWHAAHREYANASSRRWREDNRESAKELNKIWSSKNPHKRKEYYRRYYAKILQRNFLRRLMLQNVSGTFSLEQWEEKKREYGFSCPGCLRSEPEITLTRDHIVPVTRGGTNDISNIQPLCVQCNASKGNRTCAFFPPSLVVK